MRARIVLKPLGEVSVDFPDWTDHYSLDVENRRAAPRVNRQFSIRYVYSGRPVAQGVALNLSATGARVVLEQSPWGETEVTLQLADRVDVLARTVWEAPLAGGRRIAGLRFEGLAADQRRALDNLLRELAA